MTQTNYYLDAYTDEVIPCASTLDAWAEWLSKPACAKDGPSYVATFRAIGPRLDLEPVQ